MKPQTRRDRLVSLDALTSEQMAELHDATTPVQFIAGQEIHRQGATNCRCLFVVKGRVDLVFDDADGRMVVGCARAGDVIGQLLLVSHNPSPIGAVARTDVRALALTRDVFDRLLREQSPLALHFQQMLLASSVSQLRTITDRLVAVGREVNRELQRGGELSDRARLRMTGEVKIARAALHEPAVRVRDLGKVELIVAEADELRRYGR